jgi:hypothetical protein
MILNGKIVFQTLDKIIIQKAFYQEQMKYVMQMHLNYIRSMIINEIIFYFKNINSK